jgi:acyl-coenzyme A synthetase/AMP-(fatty) acid ligase
MTFAPPERFNIAEYFLDARIAEGKGERLAILTDDSRYTYAQVRERANRIANLLHESGVRAEERVLLIQPDGLDMAASSRSRTLAIFSTTPEPGGRSYTHPPWRTSRPPGKRPTLT